MTVSSGTQLGPYVVGERLASSGSGEWYAASEAALERPVSVLVASLPDDESAADEVRERARRLATLTDARLLPVYSQGEDDRTLWLATRRIGGRSLAEIERIETGRAARLGSQLARQLAALQEAGLAPELVTAEDVVVEGAGDDERAWLLPAPARPASDDAATVTRSLVELLNERAPKPLLDRPPPDPETLAEELAPLVLERPSRRALLLAAIVGLVLLGGAAVVAALLIRDSGSSDANTPPARVTARIPLGAAVAALTADDENVWAATPSGALINIDINSESVVGAPRKLFPNNVYVDLVSDGDSLWAGGPSLLLRLDHSTGRVLERKRLGPREVAGVLPTSGPLWVTMNDTGSQLADLFKFDLKTDREVAIGLAGLYAVPVMATGEDVWTIGGDASFTRLRAQRASTTIGVGNQAGFPTQHEGRVWIPTRIDRTIVAVDPVRMTLEHVLHFDAEPWRAIVGAGSIWVLTQNPSQIYRIDPVTGQFLGPPLEAPAGAEFIRYSGGSLWVDDPKAKALMRLAPATPAPGARPAPVDDVLRNGPIPRDVRLRVTAFEPRFSVQVADDSWLAQALGWGSGPQFELFRYRRIPTNVVGVSFAVTAQAFGPGGRLVPVRTPNDFLRVLRRNPSIRITSVGRATLGSRRGLRVRFETVPKPPFPRLCRGTGCVLLFPIPRGSFVLFPGNEEFTIVQHGRGLFLVDASFGVRTDPAIARKFNHLIDSIQFEQ